MRLLSKVRERIDPAVRRENLLRQVWPNTLTIETSFACNLDCIMCPRSSGSFESRSGKESALLLPEVFRHILPSVERFKHVHLTGWGEPLANKHLLDYIAQLKERGREVSFANNGTLLTEDVSRRLLELRIEEINVSCDASTAETFERVRGKGHFDRLVENLRRFCALREEVGHHCPVQWVFVMMQSNLAEVPDAVRLAGECGVDMFVAKHLETALDDNELGEALFDTGRVAAPSAEVMQRYRKTMEEGRRIAEGYPRMRFIEHPPFNPGERYCHLRPEVLVVVDHEGWLSPCCYTMPMNTRPYQKELSREEKQFLIGNITETPMEELILSEKYRNFLEDFRNNRTPKTCQGCIQMARRPPTDGPGR